MHRVKELISDESKLQHLRRREDNLSLGPHGHGNEAFRSAGCSHPANWAWNLAAPCGRDGLTRLRAVAWRALWRMTSRVELARLKHGHSSRRNAWLGTSCTCKACCNGPMWVLQEVDRFHWTAITKKSPHMNAREDCQFNRKSERILPDTQYFALTNRMKFL